MNFERVLQKVLWRLVMRKWLGLGILLGAGLGSVAWAQGSAGFDGQYIGELSLTKVISGDCTGPRWARATR